MESGKTLIKQVTEVALSTDRGMNVNNHSSTQKPVSICSQKMTWISQWQDQVEGRNYEREQEKNCFASCLSHFLTPPPHPRIL